MTRPFQLGTNKLLNDINASGDKSEEIIHEKMSAVDDIIHK